MRAASRRVWIRWKKRRLRARSSATTIMSAGRPRRWASPAPRCTGGWRNMASDRYYAGIALRVALLVSTIVLLAWMILHTDWYVSMGLLAIATATEAVLVMHFCP